MYSSSPGNCLPANYGSSFFLFDQSFSLAFQLLCENSLSNFPILKEKKCLYVHVMKVDVLRNNHTTFDSTGMDLRSARRSRKDNSCIMPWWYQHVIRTHLLQSTFFIEIKKWMRKFYMLSWHTAIERVDISTHQIEKNNNNTTNTRAHPPTLK